MPRKPQQNRSRATVEAIVEAGFICVARRGVEATTTRDIADAAGIGVGSLYEYFANKEAIYETMYTRLIAELVETIRAIQPELFRLQIADAVRRILYAVGELLQQNDRRYLRCARYAMQAEIRMDTAPLAKLLNEVIVQYVMHQPRYLRVRNIPTMTYIFIHGGIYTLMHHLNENSPTQSYDELVDGLANMVGHYAEHELALQSPP